VSWQSGRPLFAAALLVVGALAAPPASAADDGAQPFVGDPILDSTHDLPALRRTMATSLAIQSGRHGAVVALHLAAIQQLNTHWADGLEAGALGATVQRSVTAHRVGVVLALTAVSVRGLAAAGTGSARTLAGGLHGFGAPFLIGASVDAAAAANALSAGIRLRRARRADDGLAGNRRSSVMLSEWTLGIGGVLSAISAVTQLLVGGAALDFALYETRRDRGVRARPGGGTAQISLTIEASRLVLVGRF
jgi:hypothetical protein